MDERFIEEGRCGSAQIDASKHFNLYFVILCVCTSNVINYFIYYVFYLKPPENVLIPMPGSSVQAAPGHLLSSPLLTQTSTVSGAVFLRPFPQHQQPAAMRNLAVFITVCAFIAFMAYLSKH